MIDKDSDCKKCGNQLWKLEGLYFDSDQMRDARYCPECHTLWGTYAHGLELIKTGAVDLEATCIENKALRTSLKTILGLCPKTPAKGKPMPQTEEFWKKRALMDQKLIIDQKDVISNLTKRMNDAAQKTQSLKEQLQRDRATKRPS